MMGLKKGETVTKSFQQKVSPDSCPKEWGGMRSGKRRYRAFQEECLDDSKTCWLPWISSLPATIVPDQMLHLQTIIINFHWQALYSPEFQGELGLGGWLGQAGPLERYNWSLEFDCTSECRHTSAVSQGGDTHFWKSVKCERGGQWKAWQCPVKVLPPLFKPLLKLLNSKPWMCRDSS